MKQLYIVLVIVKLIIRVLLYSIIYCPLAQCAGQNMVKISNDW